MGSTRIRGKKLGLDIGPDEVWADCTKAELVPEDADGDALTFEDAQAGNTAAWKLALSAIQSTDPDSLHMLLLENVGEELPFTFAPHGNETPSTTQPHWTGNLRVTLPPSIGGEASRDANNAYTFDIELEVIDQPVKVTA